MTFEMLPNELLIECFKYLNAIDIFYIFDRFCNHQLSNSEMKKQIYSLQLSDGVIRYQVEAFLSRFSLTEFPNLRSLSLIYVSSTQYRMFELIPVLPFVTQLSSFHLKRYGHGCTQIVSILPMSQLQRLTLPHLPHFCEKIDNMSSMINLTISSCSAKLLCRILIHAFKLKHLYVGSISRTSLAENLDANEQLCVEHPAIHLKHFTTTIFSNQFNQLFKILKHTPNLKNLTISCFNDVSEIVAVQWEDLIISSLPYLKIFEFQFTYSEHSDIYSIFQQFQTDFWRKQHH